MNFSMLSINFRILCILVVTVPLFLQSCFFDIRSPLATNKLTTFQLSSDDYQILGTVEADGAIHSAFFLIYWGGDGFSAIDSKVKQIGGDDFINFYMDIHAYNLLFVYNRFSWKARATAIKYRDKIKK